MGTRIEDKPKRKRNKISNRIILDDASQKYVDDWIKQISPFVKGVKLTRAAVVNWKLSTQSVELSKSDLTQARKDFYNEEKFTEWALGELKKAKSNGEALTLAELINRNSISQKSSKVKNKLTQSDTKKSELVGKNKEVFEFKGGKSV